MKRAQRTTKGGGRTGRTPARRDDRHDDLAGFTADGVAPLTVARILALQRTAGNAEVTRLLSTQRTAVQRVGAVTYKRKFSAGVMTDILDASEGRAGSTGVAGHPRSQHVGSRDDTLAIARAEGKRKTLYRSRTSQDQAAAGALGSSAGQTELTKLDADPALNRVVVKDAATHPVQVWAATPTSTEADKATAAKTTVIVDRLPTLPAPEIHIQTCFPVS